MSLTMIQEDLDKILHALADRFADEGNARAVAVLATGKATIKQTGHAYTPPLTTQLNPRQFWEQAVSRTDDMTADHARAATAVEIRAPNRVAVIFSAKYQFSKAFLARPERAAKLEEALAAVAGRRMRLEFELAGEPVGSDKLTAVRDMAEGSLYTVYIQLPQALYSQLRGTQEELEAEFRERATEITRLYDSEWIEEFVVSAELVEDPKWRDRAKAWVTGQGVTNQGRVRSDNLAPRECEGLLFRSQEEINLFRALRTRGVAMAPLAVFVRGDGQTYRRIEPDFLLIKRGVVMVVEVDGPVHRESPQVASERLTMLSREGVHVERVSASECRDKERATACAERLLGIMEKLRGNK